MVTIDGTRHLAGVLPGAYPLPPQLSGEAPPKFDGSLAEFAATLPADVAPQMWNRAKICPECSKACAVTLVSCNGCGASLAAAEVTATENVVMGFVYGVGRGAKFALRLSLRHESADTLVYDDPLARSTCHLNAVPSDVHLPDWRHLLLQPTKALALLRRLEERAWEAVEAGVYAHPGWRAEVLRPGAVAEAAELRPHCIAALNAVPLSVTPAPPLHLSFYMTCTFSAPAPTLHLPG